MRLATIKYLGICALVLLVGGFALGCEPSNGAGKGTVTPIDGTCTPGDSFLADDGCNTCGCPDSGKIEDAMCTEMACGPIGGLCKTDNDCGAGATPPYCDGTVLYGSETVGCNGKTGKCETKPAKPKQDCADNGLICFDGACVTSTDDTCTPGESFLADDGCNTCGCPASGKKSEAMCTQIACLSCTSDLECGDAATPPYCDGSVAHDTSASFCNQDTGECEFKPLSPPKDCSEESLVCSEGVCVEDNEDTCIPGESFLAADGCNTCGCPESGKKSEASCTEMACGCISDFDCGDGATPPYCEGNLAYSSTSVGCNPETGQCESKPQQPPVDCTEQGLVCNDGECVEENFDMCTPGVSFIADDGCNTCECPESGKKSDAPCTEMACVEVCLSDDDCTDTGATEPYCDGDIAHSTQTIGCNVDNGQCEVKPVAPPKDCAEEGLTCFEGVCGQLDDGLCTPGQSFPAGDGCNTCGCPESGKKSEANCTLMACPPPA